MNTVTQAFQLLEAVADAPGTIDYSHITWSTRSQSETSHQVVDTLTTLGYLSADSSRRFTLGAGWLRLRQSAVRSLEVLVRPHLTRLVDLVGESAHLAIRDGHEVLYLAHAKSRQSMQAELTRGTAAPLHCTAAGRAILAHMPTGEVNRLLRQARTLSRETGSRLERERQLLDQLAAVIEHGYALDEGEYEQGLHCVAVAVPDDSIETAMVIAAPDARMTESLVATAVPLLQETAEAFAAELC